ncbi:MAG: hypothetical protein M3552_02685 [Planctomycetota bacterium]|nr:hypothetical protein [Planctomycetaceae bacterium]MDQ3329553.1 hypothetical protein [Planctomycetota bacterium]
MLLRTGNGAGRRSLMVAIGAILMRGSAIASDAEYEHDAIGYTTATPRNAVSRLQQRIEAGDASLSYDEDGSGWLRSVLRELGVYESSQMLVYSKTSLQRSRIGPETPRAIYFNDDVYVGFCRNGTVLEVTAADPELGAVFYSLDQQERHRPVLTRQIDNCIACHASSAHTDGVPGHVVRSVYADASGLPILSAGSFHIDHTSPIEQRWGGWYVTGTHGDQKHLGNLIARNEKQPAEFLSENLNVTDVSNRFNADGYLTPHSDIVALMVFEHQTAMHNALTQANYATKRALWDERVLDEAFGDSPETLRESTIRRIDNAAESVVECLLFSGEAKLIAPIQGTSGFAESFAAKGPRDPDGRSLRDLDLTTRLFKYPCSYLIYSEAFEALHETVKSRVSARLLEVLSGEDDDKKYSHLSSADLVAILEILRETKEGLPEDWREPPTANGK